MNKSAIEFLSGLANSAGYTVIPNWRLDQAPQCDFMKRLFALLEIDCIFDVGANEGQFGQFLRDQVGFDGLIVSFEPIPSSCTALKARSKDDNKWLVHEFALGQEAGKAKFNVMMGSQFSSFLNPDVSRVGMFSEQNRVVQEIEVEIKTLAEVVPQIIRDHDCSSLYLKLDTQGFDLQVARGAGREIQKFRALQAEASITPIYEGMPGFFDTFTEFSNAGFELSGIFPNNPGHFPRMIEFDCHMINKDYIPARLR